MTFPQTEFPRGRALPPLGLPAPRALPAGHRVPSRGPREVAGAKGARVGRAPGAAACAREAGGVCPRGRGRGCAMHAAGQGAGRASDPRLSGVRWKDCGRTHAREPRPAPLCAHASRSCSSSPPAARPDRLSSESAISTAFFLQSAPVPTGYPRTCHRCHT